MARLIGHDVALFSISGEDVLALYSAATLSFSANEIDLTAAKDDWVNRRTGTRDWEISCTKFIESTSSFMNMIVTGGFVRVLEPGENVNEGDPRQVEAELKGGRVFVWSANAPEQLESLVSEYVREGWFKPRVGDVAGQQAGF